MEARIRVVVAEDEPLMRQGLVRLLGDEGFEVVGEAQDADAARTAATSLRPDVLLLDVRMPPGGTDDGLRLAEELSVPLPDLGLLVLSHFVEVRYALRLLERRTTGVGYLLKQHVADAEVLAAAVRRIAAGGSVVDRRVVAELRDSRGVQARLARLTKREQEVLMLMAEGRSNRGIEQELVLSGRTVESHVRSIFMKLDLDHVEHDHRRVLAVLTALRGSSRG